MFKGSASNNNFAQIFKILKTVAIEMICKSTVVTDSDRTFTFFSHNIFNGGTRDLLICTKIDLTVLELYMNFKSIENFVRGNIKYF